MSAYFLDVSGQSCLELGCGAGLVGAALCRVGAAAVHLTDGNEAAVANCKYNLAINKCIEEDALDAQDTVIASYVNQVRNLTSSL